MTKDNRPKEKMRLTIELADNGIILRNPECEDEVTLALMGEGVRAEDGYGYVINHENEYKAIGRKIYNWLQHEAIQEHNDDWISTGAELDITATLTGRER